MIYKTHMAREKDKNGVKTGQTIEVTKIDVEATLMEFQAKIDALEAENVLLWEAIQTLINGTEG